MLFNTRLEPRIELCHARKLLVEYRKLVKTEQAIIYIQTCIKNNFIPTFIRNQCKKGTKYIHSKLLSEELRTKKTIINYINNNIATTESHLLNIISFTKFKAIKAYINSNIRELRVEISKKHEKKFQNFQPKNCNTQAQIEIRNLTEVPIPSAVKSALKYGLNKTIMFNTNSITNIAKFQPFTSTVLGLINGKSPHFRLKVKNKLEKALIDLNEIKNPKNIDVHILQNFLAKNPDCAFYRADKTKNLIFAKRSLYVAQTENKLKSGIFEKAKNSALKSERNQIKSTVNKYLEPIYKKFEKFDDDSMIPQIIKKYHKNDLKSGQSGRTRKMVSTFKTHKDGITFDGSNTFDIRQITSNFDSYSQRVEQFVLEILKNLTTNLKYNLRSTCDLKYHISKVKVDSNHELISLDVKKLFDNVDKNFVINLICQKVFDQKTIKLDIGLDKAGLRDILDLLVNKCCNFEFNKQIFSQRKGMPMGSSLSCLFSDLYMDFIESELLETLPFQIQCYLRFVDDILICVKKEHIPELYQIFENNRFGLKFTLERSTNGSLPQKSIRYLDKELWISNNSIQSRWAMKDTQSLTLMRYDSHNPYRYIRSVATGKLFTIISSNTTNDYLDQDLAILKKILNINGWPIPKIDQLFNSQIENIKKDLLNRYDKISQGIPIKKKCFLKSEDPEITTYNLKIDFTSPRVENIMRNLVAFLSKFVPKLKLKGDRSNDFLQK
jgi:hypothetical protein